MGRSDRDAGHNRVPAPPDINTGTIFGSSLTMRIYRQVLLGTKRLGSRSISFFFFFGEFPLENEGDGHPGITVPEGGDRVADPDDGVTVGDDH